ncbi:MAG: hypothetical protein KJ896_01740, partial [Nanoarchaeota archaeon]|nr:hypothetical protein [Nanoarchaeota archaeon]
MKTIPFSLLPEPILKKFSLSFRWLSEPLGKIFSFLDLNLKQADLKIEKEKYLSLCLTSILFTFIIIFLLLIITFSYLEAESIILVPVGITIFFCFFVFTYQIYYPKLLSEKRIRLLDRNLMPALQDLLVQTNAGVSLFDILANIANSDYGEVSKEIKTVVGKINSGTPQVKA